MNRGGKVGGLEYRKMGGNLLLVNYWLFQIISNFNPKFKEDGGNGLNYMH